MTLRGSYTEAFHAPTLLELSPAGQQAFPLVVDPFSNFTLNQVEERINGNPFLQPETAYEWTYGIVLQPEVDQGPDGERRLVAHRHALHRCDARLAIPYQ